MVAKQTKRIDPEEAADMLRAGSSVREVAAHFNVSTQAVYLAIRQGRVPKDAA
jgi:uncharacterized protein (DUF433 family)